jgi:glycosyltransferase involved in cell wall biosynthesis
VRIDQLIPTIVERDAVSAHTFEAQRVLRDLGVESEIFAQNIGPSLRGRVRGLEALTDFDSDSRWLLYQASIGSPVAEAFATHPAPKLVNYHNITPADLVDRFEPRMAELLRLGRAQMGQLAPLTRLGIAVSGYNRADLVELGYRSTAVIPLLADLSVPAEPDAALATRLAQERRGGSSCWMFVGQIAAHKAQHALIEALAFYRTAFDAPAHLHLVGREASPGYAGGLWQLARALQVADAVHLEGSVSGSELAAFYAAADVFVCCSDHEGFCAPLIEAMHNRVPVVAFGAAAVPETVGSAALVLPSRTASLVATAVHRALSDEGLRQELLDAGTRRARDFDLDRSRTSFAQAVSAVVSAP